MFGLERFWEKMLGSNSRPPSPEDQIEEFINELNINSSEFLVLFRKHHQSLCQSVQNCRRMSERIKHLQYTLKACLALSVLFGALTVVVAVAIALDQGYFAIQVMIVFTFVFPMYPAFGLFEERPKCTKIVKSSTEDFSRKLSLLKPKLEKVKHVCEELRRRCWSVLGGAERVNIMRLEKSVLEMFVLTEGLRSPVSADSLAQVYEEYSEVFSKLDKMDVQLTFYSGTATLIPSDFVE